MTENLDTGNIILRLRIERGWSQSELAERAGGMNVAQVSRYESGKVSPGAKAVFRLAKAFGVEPATIAPTAYAVKTVPNVLRAPYGDAGLEIDLPSDLEQKLGEAARANGRSMNAEIIARLAASFEVPQGTEAREQVRHLEYALGVEATVSAMAAIALKALATDIPSELHQRIDVEAAHMLADKIISKPAPRLDADNGLEEFLASIKNTAEFIDKRLGRTDTQLSASLHDLSKASPASQERIVKDASRAKPLEP